MAYMEQTSQLQCAKELDAVSYYFNSEWSYF